MLVWGEWNCRLIFCISYNYFMNELSLKDDVKGRSKFHAISSYLAMFPKETPSKYIEQYSNEGDLIYDPFSGRGTTLLEARVLNRTAIGNDLNPLAYVISRTRINKLKEGEIYSRIDDLEFQFNLINSREIFSNKKF
ncbi:MAG: hypothetical protein GQ557_01580, partial [Mycoplasmataceae bacterium]|nr:hypothetical protein [Mycoplasmataceae bacterium]